MLIQNQNNPLAPITSPSADQLLNAYQQQAAALRGEAQTKSDALPSTNPFKASAGQQDAQQQHIAATEQYAAPIGTNIFDINTAYTDEHHQRFAKNLDNDPAFNEIEGPYFEFLNNIRADLQAGKISESDAVSMVSDYGQNEINPILDKHHGPHSPTHKISLHAKDTGSK